MTSLFEATSRRDIDLVRKLLSDPEVDVNQQEPNNKYTPLHQACLKGFVEIVQLLLQHPKIDINRGKFDNETPFSMAFWSGHVPVIQEMLQHPGVDVNRQRNDGATALWFAARDGYLDCAKWTIALWQGPGWLDLAARVDSSWDNSSGTNALENAKVLKRVEVCILLESYSKNPLQTKLRIQKELGLIEPLAAMYFAPVVMVSDGYFRLKTLPPSSPVSETNTRRFFLIAASLPIELQMLLCYRALCSPWEIIHVKETEQALITWMRSEKPHPLS